MFIKSSTYTKSNTKFSYVDKCIYNITQKQDKKKNFLKYRNCKTYFISTLKYTINIG